MSKFYVPKKPSPVLSRKALDFLVNIHIPYLVSMTKIQLTWFLPVTKGGLSIESYLSFINKTKKNIIDSLIFRKINYFEYRQYMQFVTSNEIQIKSSWLNSKINKLGLGADLEKAGRLLKEIKELLVDLSACYRSVILGGKITDLYNKTIKAVYYTSCIELAIDGLQQAQATSCIIEKEGLFIHSLQSLTAAYHFFKTNSFMGAKKLEDYAAELIYTSVSNYDMERLEFNFQDSNLLDVFKIVAEGLVSNTAITVVNFNFDAEEVSFNVSGEAISGIGSEGAKILAGVLNYNKVIEEVDLQCNSVGDKGAEAFAEMLKGNDTLKILDLCFHNNITSIGFIALAEALKQNKGLIELNVGDYDDECDIDDVRVAKAFSEMLVVNNTLTNLNFYTNALDDNWVKCLANGLMGNGTLEELTVGGTITSAGIACIVKALAGNQEFHTLDLSSIDIDEDGALELLLLLQLNHNVRTIYFDPSHISLDMLSEIDITLARNNQDYEKDDIGLPGDLDDVDVF